MVHFSALRREQDKRRRYRNMIEKWEWISDIGSKKLWLIHHEKWQVIVSCVESSKMHVRVSIDSQKLFFISQLVWFFFGHHQKDFTGFKNVLFDTFFSLSSQWKRLLTIKHPKLEMRCAMRSICDRTKTSFSSSISKTIISISLVVFMPHKTLSALWKLIFIFSVNFVFLTFSWRIKISSKTHLNKFNYDRRALGRLKLFFLC